MFTVTANNYSNPKVVISITDLNFHLALRIAVILEGSFREVDIINDETGEVYSHCYKNEEAFCRRLSEGAAMDTIKRILNDR